MGGVSVGNNNGITIVTDFDMQHNSHDPPPSVVTRRRGRTAETGHAWLCYPRVTGAAGAYIRLSRYCRVWHDHRLLFFLARSHSGRADVHPTKTKTKTQTDHPKGRRESLPLGESVGQRGEKGGRG